MGKGLSLDQVEVLTVFEQMYWETGTPPSVQAVSSRGLFTVDRVTKCFNNDIFQQALKARGIDTTGWKENSRENLTPLQLMAANSLLNNFDKRSMREKLQACNVTTQQLNVWMRDPVFAGFLRRRAEEQFKTADFAAYNGLVKAVDSGDVRALQLFFEMRGIYNPKMQVEVNVNVVVNQIVEIVQRHVTDPNILLAIADDIEKLTENKSLMAGG